MTPYIDQDCNDHQDTVYDTGWDESGGPVVAPNITTLTRVSLRRETREMDVVVRAFMMSCGDVMAEFFHIIVLLRDHVTCLIRFSTDDYLIITL